VNTVSHKVCSPQKHDDARKTRVSSGNWMLISDPDPGIDVSLRHRQCPLRNFEVSALACVTKRGLVILHSAQIQRTLHPVASVQRGLPRLTKPLYRTISGSMLSSSHFAASRCPRAHAKDNEDDDIHIWYETKAEAPPVTCPHGWSALPSAHHLDFSAPQGQAHARPSAHLIECTIYYQLRGLQGTDTRRFAFETGAEAGHTLSAANTPYTLLRRPVCD
jgi:hypothetical protein